jgi:hypothetical protein
MGIIQTNSDSTPIFNPVLNPQNKLENIENELSIWNRNYNHKPNIVEGFTESFVQMETISGLHETISKQFNQFFENKAGECQDNTASFIVFLQNSVDNLAKNYVHLFSFDDYSNQTKENQENQKFDQEFISQQLFTLFTFPFFLFITYNWFFLMFYTNTVGENGKNRINADVKPITETDFYQNKFLPVLNYVPISYVLKPILLYFFEFPLKPVMTADYTLNVVLREKLGQFIPDSLSIFVFYLVFIGLLSVDNKFCTISEKEEPSENSEKGEYDLCGDDLDDPTQHNSKTPNSKNAGSSCDKIKQVTNRFFQAIKSLCIIVIVFFWLFYVGNFTLENVQYLQGLPWFISIIVVMFVIIIMFILRLVINLSDSFILLSASLVTLYLFIYSFFGMCWYSGIFGKDFSFSLILSLPNRIYTLITAMDKFMQGITTNEQDSETENESSWSKFVRFVLRFISTSKFTLILGVLLFTGFIKSLVLIKSSSLRISSALIFIFLTGVVSMFRGNIEI